MLTIPRAEIQAIARRHNVDYELNFDPDIRWLRAMVQYLRDGADFGTPTPEVLAEADALAALADRYEQKAS